MQPTQGNAAPQMNALQQAIATHQQLQGQAGSQQMMPQGAQNPLEQAFMSFLQSQHGQSGQQSFLNFLPWFRTQSNELEQSQQVKVPQQQTQQVAQTAFQPPTQAHSVQSGQDLSNQSIQQQTNKSGDMSSFFGPQGVL